MDESNMNRVRIGWTGFHYVEEGWSAGREFHFLEWVTDEDSAYVSRANGNKGNPLTDTTKWVCIASGKAATEAARRCLELIGTLTGIKNAALAATDRASQAAAGASDAAGAADAAAGRASQSAMLANKAVEAANTKTAELDAVVRALESALSLTPTRMEVSVLETVSTSNKVPQRIAVQLYPEHVSQSVLFRRVSGTSADADPSGRLTLTGTGTTVFWVIPTQNTPLWKEVRVSVRKPVIRLTSSGKVRLAGNRMRIV